MTWNGMKFNLFWYFVLNVSREIYKETLNYYFIYSCSRLNFLDGMNFFVYILLIDGLFEWNGINRDYVYVISKNEIMGIFCQTKLKRAYETNSIRFKSSTKTIFYFSTLHISADEKFVRYDTYEWSAAHENHCNYCYHKIIQHNHRHLSSILQTISVLGNRFSFRDEKKDQKKRNNVALFSLSSHWLSAFVSVRNEFRQQSTDLNAFFNAQFNLIIPSGWRIKFHKMEHIIRRIISVCNQNRHDDLYFVCDFCDAFVCRVNLSGSDALMD